MEFFEEVFEKIHTEIRADEVIIGGDLNVYLDLKLDRKGGNPKMSRSVGLLNEYLEHFEYLDVWRYLHPEKFCYTWKQTRPFIGTRLDYIFLPISLVNMVKKCEIISGCKSDHQFLVLDIGLEDSIRGPGFWKFNCSLLEDKEFVDGTNEIIDKFTLDEGERDPDVVYDEVTDFRTQDPAMKWEILKIKITSFAQAYSKGESK